MITKERGLKPKVSVIVPVFNAQDHIRDCIKSLLDQTLYDCEFLFINDGSRDHSRQIIEEYKNKERRIKLINQENKGVSSARNNGLSSASGDYIGFVDADDFVDKEMFSTLYQSAKTSNVDLILSNLKGENQQETQDYPFPFNRDIDSGYLFSYLLENENCNTVCNKLYKSRVIKENEIRFPEHLALGEDGIFNLLYVSKASAFRYINYLGYFYREVIGSATRNIKNIDYFEGSLQIYNLTLPMNCLKQSDVDEVNLLRSKKLIKNVISYTYLYFSSSEELTLLNRFIYIRRMISHEDVRKALANVYQILSRDLGRYEKYLLEMIKLKSTIGVFILTSYSRLRNQ
ncbi:glycosyltransferase [Halobacillus sp. BBL2006]|uniref:glycosyltransferase family 2 protein n=1 Tax=Halobacillus sp. BBL2006 TaxID=1543706 RepID=UPI000542562D|nr:glycosyltransferase [Halobacillus sp. BBL2006]KHE69238.1 glycosyl transferase family 2 [Halobacillus sp. BBL2006]